jgi:hypothetical protein
MKNNVVKIVARDATENMAYRSFFGEVESRNLNFWLEEILF